VNAFVTSVVWSIWFSSALTPTARQYSWKIWPTARPRGVAVTVSLKLTGWPYSLSSCFALSGL
jgi:hypothetical protein